MKDERWRAAIEVAFTRKFAIVVEAVHYDDAERIYHELRAESGRERESLVNPTKALKLARPVRPGSLAEKIEAAHPVARALVSNLFGEVICCERREELREHEAAILPDGFSSRGAFVDRVRHYDNLPFVGKRGLEQQRTWKEKELAARESEERRLEPLERACAEAQREWRAEFETPVDLYRELARPARCPVCRRNFRGTSSN